MKKLVALLLLVPTLVLAQHYHQHPHHQPHWRYSNGHWSWMVPVIIGGVVVYEATRQPPAVVIQQPQIPENCTAWTEVQMPDGKIYRERTCTK